MIITTNDRPGAGAVTAGWEHGYSCTCTRTAPRHRWTAGEPTIISTDIESITLDKDRAADRALGFFASNGPLPTLWRSVGDSRGDYLIADHVHLAGHDVAHIDVRPTDGVLERPYPVIAIGDLIHDDAGAVFFSCWVDKLGSGEPAG